MTIFGVIAAIIVVCILLVLVGANGHNDLVHLVMSIGRFFVRPFEHLIPQDTIKQDIVVNWGIAAIVYLLVGSFLARLTSRW